MFLGPIKPSAAVQSLAIVSTYDELCGIAGYTRALESQLRPHADVTVFDLDQYLLRSPHARVQVMADRHIRDIAAKLSAFDSVNIQLEYGTLGRTRAQILRRLRRLIRAARIVSITFHTILGSEPLDRPAVGEALRRGRLTTAVRMIARHAREASLAVATYRFLRRRQHLQHINVIVHTRRDARLLHDVYRLKNVHHHPLSFVAPEQAEAIRRTTTRDDFPLLAVLPEQARLIGTFGFLSPYKGFETALRALQYLPEDYHLLIFGGTHPQEIRKHLPLHPYIQTLFDEGNIGRNLLETIRGAGTPVTVSVDEAAARLVAHHPADMQRRVHFMGVHDDDAFMRAMALCDAVVLPYLEVGQSGSGPMAMALEMGCRVIASRTHSFLQYARYHPNEIEFFDIGNYPQLAELIRAERPSKRGARALTYNSTTNAALYLAANRLRGLPARAAKGSVSERSSPSGEAVPTEAVR